MNKKIIDYITGELNLIDTLRFKWQLHRDSEMKKTLKKYKTTWEALTFWKEKVPVPEIKMVSSVSYRLRLKHAFLLIIAIIGLGIGFYIGFNSYISASDYMNYALEVLYEE